MRYQPIFVTNEGGIMDGQHRFEAARTLGLPIYYTEAEWGDDDPRTDQAIILLNTTTNTWSQEEYVHYYAEKLGGVYRELEEFYEANSWLRLSNAIVVFPEPTINSVQIKEGYSAFHRNPNLDRIMAFLSSEQVRGMANSTNKHRPFVCAARNFIESHTDKQVAKLKANIDRVTKQVAEKDYGVIFENIIKRRAVR